VCGRARRLTRRALCFIVKEAAIRFNGINIVILK
jgi:hypothetical protein